MVFKNLSSSRVTRYSTSLAWGGWPVERSRVISSAISFLRDNKIKANPFLEEKMSEIEERLSARTKRFRVVPGDAARRAAGE